MYLGIILSLFSACVKNENHIEFTGSADMLQGKWMVKQVKGVDVTANEVFIDVKTFGEYEMYDGCNAGNGHYSTAGNNSIEFKYPALTYKYCEIYKTVAPGAYITSVRKFSVSQSRLILYDGRGKVIIEAFKQ